MIESLCLIYAKFHCCILMLESYFSHAMNLCTIQISPKLHIFLLLDFYLLKILMREIFFDKMVKLINSLVEPMDQ